jgi:23S rRNA (guanine745-N1)-methyltransferase
MNPLVSVVCPICSETLQRSEQSYTCKNRHNFDLSREGYLSLLHGRNSYQQIGDDKLMIQARVRVHKLPAFMGLARDMTGYCPRIGESDSILDIGCGDGFFLDQVTRAATIPSQGVGVDISKGALAKAAKSYPQLSFVRTDASHVRLPFEDSSFGLVLSIFAPRPIDEIRRVLRADGAWLIVTATQEHLREIRGFLPLAAIGTGKLDAPTSRSYSILRSGTLNYVSEVAHHDLVSIIEMSPSIHRLRREFGEKWSERVPRELRVTFSFSVTLLGREPWQILQKRE